MGDPFRVDVLPIASPGGASHAPVIERRPLRGRNAVQPYRSKKFGVRKKKFGVRKKKFGASKKYFGGSKFLCAIGWW